MGPSLQFIEEKLAIFFSQSVVDVEEYAFQMRLRHL